MGTNSARRRRQAPTTSSKKDSSSKSKETTTKTGVTEKPTNNNGDVVAAAAATDDDWKKIVTKHPLFWALVLIGIPYGLHLTARWVLLQHPPVGMARPAVGLTDARQVLILGSMSSGTSSMASALQNELQLEVGHEDSDTLWKFVRDGTVSWFHGIRYWPTDDDDEAMTTTNNNTNTNPESDHNEFSTSSSSSTTAPSLSIPHQLCKVSWFFRTNRQNYGFGPTLFGTPAYNCSFMHPEFHSCYLHACHLAMEREYGCAVGGNNNNNNCATPYQTTLLQTREPWKIVQSLAAKYCWKDEEQQFASKTPSTLRWLLEALQLIEKQQDGGGGSSNDDDDFAASPCVIHMLEYVVGYYNTILDNGGADITMYKIESTSPCQVAKMAGLLDPSTTIYQPNHERIMQLCGDDGSTTTTTSSKNDNHKLLPKPTNTINKGRVTREDLMPHYSPAHLERLKALYERLGYEYKDV